MRSAPGSTMVAPGALRGRGPPTELSPLIDVYITSHVRLQTIKHKEAEKMELEGNGELFWLYRLRQSGLFDAETPQGALLEPSPIHDPRLCEGCRYGPCEWLQAQLDRALGSTRSRETPTT